MDVIIFVITTCLVPTLIEILLFNMWGFLKPHDVGYLPGYTILFTIFGIVLFTNFSLWYILNVSVPSEQIASQESPMDDDGLEPLRREIQKLSQ